MDEDFQGLEEQDKRCSVCGDIAKLQKTPSGKFFWSCDEHRLPAFSRLIRRGLEDWSRGGRLRENNTEKKGISMYSSWKELSVFFLGLFLFLVLVIAAVFLQKRQDLEKRESEARFVIEKIDAETRLLNARVELIRASRMTEKPE